jgi:hypothetical protein
MSKEMKSFNTFVPVNEAKAFDLDKLKKAYSSMPDRLPLDKSRELSKVVNKFSKDELLQVRKADIKWLSSMATTALISKHKMTAAALRKK